MSEPVNPLFEEEKEFLERKKLEYERALRGDVEQLKEQGVQVGKVALIGVGVVSGIWLLAKALGGRKRRKAYEWDDENGDDYRDTDYHSQYFADLDDDDNERWTDPADHYFGSDDEAPDYGHGPVYHTDTDRYDDPTAPLGPTSFDDRDADDDNGLADFPDFPAHSEASHGDADRPFYSEEHSHPHANLPYDDSRRLPDGDEFEAQGPSLGTRLLTFAKSDLGKAVLGQAVSIVAALATKALSDRFSPDEADTAKYSDLAGSTEVSDGYAHGHPATPQPAAPDATAFAADPITYREPLA